MAKWRTGVGKDKHPYLAWQEALKTYPAVTKEHEGMVYARFPDDSYARFVPPDEARGFLEEGYAQVITHHSGQFTAQKIIDGIHAYCSQCGDEIWCDHKGKATPTHRFELPGGTVNVCSECQRNLVVRSLVGE